VYAAPTFSTKVYLKLIIPPMNSDSSIPDLSITSDRKLLRNLQVRHVDLELKSIELEVQNEHLRSTQALYEVSEGYYADLFNNAPIGYLTLTENELISEANKTATELFGIERPNLLYRRFASLIAAEDGDRWYLLFAQLIKYNQAVDIELMLKHGQGREFPVQLNCLSINGKVRISITDLSNIRQAETVLRDFEEAIAIQAEHLHPLKNHIDLIHDLQKITSLVPGMVYKFRLRPDGSAHFPFASEGIRELFQLSPDDVRNDASQLFALIHPDDFDGVVASIQKAVQDLGPWSHEFRVTFYDGTVRWVSGSSLPEQENGGSKLWYWYGFMTDITDRKHIEHELRDSQFLWKFAIEGAGDGVWDWNVQTNESIFSRIWKEMLGYSEDDILPTHNEWLQRIHSEDKLSVLAALQAYLDKMTETYAVEYRLRCKDDSYKWILSRGIVAEYTKDGSPLRMIGTHTEITKRKFQEQQDREHLNQLAHVTRLGLMGEMATGIAHEVNQPLTATVNYANALKLLTTVDEPDLEKITKVASLVSEQALRAGKIIHRMRAFCQNQSTNTEATDINTLIDDSVLLCSAEIKKHNILLKLNLTDDLPTLQLDSIKIEQVMINLIRNGIDAMAKSKTNDPKTITISSLMLDENNLQIQIKDTGIGIEQDQQNNLFMPFYTTKTEGMGMGLSICNSLITAHNGTLTFDSQPGLGTCFYLTLPYLTLPYQ
jgi:PAS domain S-box-containing protein